MLWLQDTHSYKHIFQITLLHLINNCSVVSSWLYDLYCVDGLYNSLKHQTKMLRLDHVTPGVVYHKHIFCFCFLFFHRCVVTEFEKTIAQLQGMSVDCWTIHTAHLVELHASNTQVLGSSPGFVTDILPPPLIQMERLPVTCRLKPSKMTRLTGHHYMYGVEVTLNPTKTKHICMFTSTHPQTCMCTHTFTCMCIHTKMVFCLFNLKDQETFVTSIHISQLLYYFVI